MILFIITKLMAVLLAVYIVRRMRHTRYRSHLWKLTTIGAIGFTVLAVAPLVLNVPKILTAASIDLAILCVTVSGILYYVNRKSAAASGSGQPVP